MKESRYIVFVLFRTLYTVTIFIGKFFENIPKFETIRVHFDDTQLFFCCPQGSRRCSSGIKNLLTIYSLLDLVLILHPHEDLKNVRLVDTEDADPEAGTADVQEAGNALAASKRQNTCRSKVPPSFTAKEQ